MKPEALATSRERANTLARADARLPPGTGRATVAKWLGRIVFYGLLTCLALAAVPYGTAEPWWQALYGCLVFLLTALAALEMTVSRVWPRGAWLWLMLPLAGILALMVVQTLPLSAPPLPVTQPVWWSISGDPYETRFVTFRLLSLMLTGLLLFHYTNSPRRLRVLTGVVVGVGVASALFSLARLAGQRAEGFFLPRLPVGDKRGGQFIGRNHFALMMEMSLGVVLGLLAVRGRHRQQWLLLLGPAFLLWAALVLTVSRGGLMAFAAQIVFAILLAGAMASTQSAWGRYLGRSWAVRGALAVILLLGIGLGALWLGGDDLVGRLQEGAGEISNRQSSAVTRDKANRAGIWSATWLTFKTHPWLGVGVGGYSAVFPTYHEGSGRLTPQQAHNEYLEVLASGGVVGFILMTWFLALLAWQARWRLMTHDSFRQAAGVGAIVGLFGVAVHSLVDFGLHITINALLFVGLCVIATADKRVAEKSRRRHGEPPVTPTEAMPSLLAWLRLPNPLATRRLRLPVPAGYALALASAVLCLWGAWVFGWMGLSRLLSNYGRTATGQNPAQYQAADFAVVGTPKDPEAHSARGLALLTQQRNGEALGEFEQAAALRPRSYLAWMQLGRARDIAGREQEAIAPFREAIRLAPYYADPRWQLGNLLFRMGQAEAGFTEMRRAKQSNRDLLPNFLDLAWSATDGDANAVINIVQPDTDWEHFTLANYLLGKKRVPEAFAQIHALGSLSDDERRTLVGGLVNAAAIREAYQVWADGQPEARRAQGGIGLIWDGDFEGDLPAGETIYGWRWRKEEPGASFVREPNQPHTGTYSFCIIYKNQTVPGQSILAQLVPVEPKTRYRLSFVARTADMVTAGWPLVALSDDFNHLNLGQTEIKAAAGWQSYQIDFVTGEKTSGVTLALKRENCPSEPCAIFGTLWLDSFVLKKN